MWYGPNLYKMLEAEWVREARTRPARDACARWANENNVLEGLASPEEVVRVCQARGDGQRSNAVLGAVLGRAGEDVWAARTVLQAVLPGLAGLSRRALPVVGPHRCWQGVDELDQQVVSTACECIATLSPAQPQWPAQAIISQTWRRLRTAMRADQRRRSRTDYMLVDLNEPLAASSLTPAEELADVLAEAIESGVLEEVDGWLVFASRAEDRDMRLLAAELDRHPRWAWRRRARAEGALVGSGSSLGRVG